MNLKADTLTEEQVSEFKEAFSLFVSTILNSSCGRLHSVQTRPLLYRIKLTFLRQQDKDGDGTSAEVHGASTTAVLAIVLCIELATDFCDKDKSLPKSLGPSCDLWAKTLASLSSKI